MADTALRMTGTLDPRSDWDASRCPIAGTLDIVGNRSSFLVMREAFYGTTRFDDFVERAGISEAIAAARLKSLVEEGLLERIRYQEPGRRGRFEYHLTEAGVDFFPVLASMMVWMKRWRGGANVDIQHRDCGAPVEAQLRCTDGHDVTVSDIDLVANGSIPRAKSAATAH
ncbi:winged helix-turn-helix transcriptional regulator [Gryllotalpicola reticulitermitis]|uniref:Winged helix-turn-helix transcriptional regulator n=1 Tax=Gryllotalpicola reticulitermitis TaxID=1184153 RepID=A0ABV8Q4Z6_9MICO